MRDRSDNPLHLEQMLYHGATSHSRNIGDNNKMGITIKGDNRGKCNAE